MSAHRDEDFTAYAQARLAWLRRVGYLLCQDWQQADDLVQTTITSLYVHWRRARAMENIDGYARTILVHAFLNERRGGWARRVALPGQLPDLPGSVADADDALDVRGALAGLPPRQRATLVLRFYCDLNVDQSRQGPRLLRGDRQEPDRQSAGRAAPGPGAAPGNCGGPRERPAAGVGRAGEEGQSWMRPAHGHCWSG